MWTWTWAVYLFLEHIEVVNDDTDEEIKSEEGADNDEDTKE